MTLPEGASSLKLISHEGALSLKLLSPEGALSLNTGHSPVLQTNQLLQALKGRNHL